MKKERCEHLCLEITAFDEEDVITTSGIGDDSFPLDPYEDINA